MPLFLSLLTVAVLGCAHSVSSQALTPTPTLTPTLQHVEIRADPTVNLNMPTFTFNPIDSYFVKDDPNPQPQKDKLEMFPRGIYDDFPQDGVTMAFGPDLKKRIKDAIGDDCKANPEDCRKRLIPVIHNTDIGTHSKRFILITSFLVGAIVRVTVSLLVAAAVTGIVWEAAGNIPSVKYEYSDLAQIQDMGNSNKFAVRPGPAAEPTTVDFPAMSDAPTPTGKGAITIETLTSDSGDRKKGDIVYHIPEDSARRIQDLLGMLGVQSIVDSCKGYDLFHPQNSRVRRAETLEDCLRQVANMVPDLMETIPEDAVQLAEQFIPQIPASGQVIQFPVQNALVEGVHVVAISYRIIRVRVGGGNPPAPGGQAPGFSVRSFLHSNLGYAIVASAAMGAGQLVADIWIPKSAVSTDIKEDEFACPKDILCVDKECEAQEDNKEIPVRNAFCKTIKHRGCKCDRINYLDHTDVTKGYMDAQYEWLEELISLSNEKLSLQIGLRTVVSPHFGGADVDNSWRFYTANVGRGIGCDQIGSDVPNEIKPEGPSDPKMPSNMDPEKLPWPAGEFKLRVADQECHYRNNGQNPGRLFCPDREIECLEEAAKRKGSEKCSAYVTWHAAVHCDF
ncbi:hypothetical protein HBI46_082250 [Parastagonospora nodorum]|nr:hypothetical protein HBI46_082250 [Parastagonospora nodorum]KAH5700560.1 hypothetical protein HBI44_051900 [Parastagonospora nodorum]KAH6331989.1 hypothetical protein HBI37_176320 [Parastagonospora nodorum]KAH6344561.1 hypothetical protein HBI36_167680 [Parastagonospora nodorum]KAH6449563.1 hypothetical protein HBI57_190780 [Parastagonospora nodorum]